MVFEPQDPHIQTMLALSSLVTLIFPISIKNNIIITIDLCRHYRLLPWDNFLAEELWGECSLVFKDLHTT
jgi:hypothetical protein